MVDCNRVLDDGVFRELEVQSEEQFRASLHRLFEYSYDELRQMSSERRVELGISLPLLKNLISGASSMTEQEYTHLKEEMREVVDISVEREVFFKLKQRIADKDLLRAWVECLRINAPGLTVEIVGNTETPSGEMLLMLRYMPQNDQDPSEVMVTDVALVGVQQLLGEIRLKKKARIRRFTTLLQRFRRNGYDACHIAVSFKGRPALAIDLPAVPRPPEYRERPVELQARALPTYVPPHTGVGDRDFNGKVDIFVEVTLEVVESRKLYARVFMRAKEPGPDFTTAEGTSGLSPEYLLFEAPPEGTILSVPAIKDRASFLDDNWEDNICPDVDEWHRAADELARRGGPFAIIARIQKGMFTNDGLVRGWRVTGDTNGDEAGTRTGVQPSLRSFTISVRERIRQ